MTEMTYRELRDDLADALNRVKYQGATFIITRHGKRDAMLCPVPQEPSTDEHPPTTPMQARDGMFKLVETSHDSVPTTLIEARKDRIDPVDTALAFLRGYGYLADVRREDATTYTRQGWHSNGAACVFSLHLVGFGDEELREVHRISA